ncbi:hypothetical protein PGT21_010666 [Puccinia graminis f. sp. tritici]|uniref:Uncharacterized protein n=1 Tax=Puccinia graminis f. sp. tritici TaxID=56615 RepID=A0A5B0QT58_PUCGR|nr:hypothetical protein PGTUg99_024295 [Puccinia graminis f. sp. tritici]KAA1116359.1 hypothetical protein PGT21_010666 [Puccinia graminis f. sp. tritici]
MGTEAGGWVRSRSIEHQYDLVTQNARPSSKALVSSRVSHRPDKKNLRQVDLKHACTDLTSDPAINEASELDPSGGGHGFTGTACRRGRPALGRRSFSGSSSRGFSQACEYSPVKIIRNPNCACTFFWSKVAKMGRY